MKESISLDDIMKHTKKQCPKLHLHQDCDFDNWTINKTMKSCKQLNQQQPEHGQLGMHVPKRLEPQIKDFVHIVV
jgi:hypothetical protein